jgi:isopentenyl phosphate kinase
MTNVLVKFGGAVLGDKQRKDFPLDLQKIIEGYDKYAWVDNIKRLAGEFAYAYNKFRDYNWCLINGAGPFGHFLVKNKADPEIVHKSVEFLNSKIVEAFEDFGINAVPVHPVKTCYYEGDGKYNIDKMWKEMQGLIEQKKIPFTYGDVVPTKNCKGQYYNEYEVMSGDISVEQIAKIWPATKVYLATDVDGVYATIDSKLLDLQIAKEISFKPHGNYEIKFEKAKIDVTNEMKGKLESIARLNAPVRIFNGLKPGYLKRALCDDIGGTLITKG